MANSTMSSGLTINYNLYIATVPDGNSDIGVRFAFF
jgi:hypothetical protein